MAHREIGHMVNSRGRRLFFPEDIIVEIGDLSRKGFEVERREEASPGGIVRDLNV
jgi:hypothetical protein